MPIALLGKLRARITAPLALATLLVAGSQLVSRLLGVVRDHLISTTFGALGGAGAWNIDTYYAAFRVPDLVYNLLIFGVLSAAFVPLLASQKKTAVNRFASNTANVLLVAVIAIAIVVGIAATPLLRALTPGFSAADIAQTAQLLRIQLLAPVFFAISAIAGGLAQHHHRYVGYALAPVFYNLGIIAGVVFLAPTYGVYGASIGVAAGAALHALVQLPTIIRAGFRWVPTWQPNELKECVELATPRMIAVAASQLQFVLVTIFASLVGVGALAVFNYAWNLASLPLGVVGLAFATTSFATLARVAKNEKQFTAHLSHNIVGVLFWVIPAAVGLYFLRTEITQVILAGGKFDTNDLYFVAESLGYFALAIPAISLIPLLNNAFFSRKNTHTPLGAGLVALVVTLAGCMLTIDTYEATGLAIAYAAAAIVNAYLLWNTLRQDVMLAFENRIWKILGLSAVLAVLVWPAAHFWIVATFWPTLGKVLVIGAIGGGLYLATAWRLGLAVKKELPEVEEDL